MPAGRGPLAQSSGAILKGQEGVPARDCVTAQPIQAWMWGSPPSGSQEMVLGAIVRRATYSFTEKIRPRKPSSWSKGKKGKLWLPQIAKRKESMGNANVKSVNCEVCYRTQRLWGKRKNIYVEKKKTKTKTLGNLKIIIYIIIWNHTSTTT